MKPSTVVKEKNRNGGYMSVYIDQNLQTDHLKPAFYVSNCISIENELKTICPMSQSHKWRHELRSSNSNLMYWKNTLM